MPGGELAAAGITVDSENMSIDRDVAITGNLIIEEDVTVNGNVSATGDVVVGGVYTGANSDTYALTAYVILNAVAAVARIVIPSDGGGWISRFRSVLFGATGASAAIVQVGANETDIASPTLTVAAVAGDVDDSGAIPALTANSAVAAGEYVRISVTTASTNAVYAMITVEITRT